jgi:hypothetical protein
MTTTLSLNYDTTNELPGDLPPLEMDLSGFHAVVMHIHDNLPKFAIPAESFNEREPK